MESYLHIKILRASELNSNVLASAKLLANNAELNAEQIADLPTWCQSNYRQLLDLKNDVVVESFSLSAKMLKLNYVMNGRGYNNAEEIITFWGQLGLGETSAKLMHDDEGGQKPLCFHFVDGELQNESSEHLDLSSLWKSGVLEPYWSDLQALYPQLCEGETAVRLRLEIYPTKKAETKLLAGERSKVKHLYSIPVGKLDDAKRVSVKKMACKYAYLVDVGTVNVKQPDSDNLKLYLSENWDSWLDANMPYDTVKSFVLVVFRFTISGLIHPDSGRALDIAFPFGLKKYAPGNYDSSSKAPFGMYSDASALLAQDTDIVAIPVAFKKATESEHALMLEFLARLHCDKPELSELIAAQYHSATFRSRSGKARCVLRFHLKDTGTLTKIPLTFVDDDKVKLFGNELHIKYPRGDNAYAHYGVVIRDGYLSSFLHDDGQPDY